MKFSQKLKIAQVQTLTPLCVGLDPEPSRFPAPWTNDLSKIFDFCSAVVAATKDLVSCYKPQIAYFAAHGAEGQLERLMAYIHDVAASVPVILDAKRGDIGATAEQYAREAFIRYRADAVTLSPFMGFDSIEPYLRYPDRGVFLLCRTSNPGGADIQGQRLENGDYVYEHIARLASVWNATTGQIGLIVGATYPEELLRVRALAPKLPLLIPGIGAQGGSEKDAVAAWTTAPIVVSSSRAILYAPTKEGEQPMDAVRRVTIETRLRLSNAVAESTNA